MNEGAPPGNQLKKNLVAIWFCQFFAIRAFAFSMPFVPFFLQEELGVTGDKELKLFYLS